MKKYFQQDKYSVGIVAGLGSELCAALLLWIGLLIAHEPIAAHLRWFGVIFIPLLLVLRYYAKKAIYVKATKAVITTFFVTFIAFIFIIL